MHRTQVLLEQEQYERLRDEAERAGVSIGHLIRQALAERYGREDRRGALRAALRESAGAWVALDVDGEEYVERLRPGLEARWTEHEWT
jgi:predicted DNA-binding ribbon-helix-helix protein